MENNKTLICHFNDNTDLYINACTLPSPDIVVYYDSISDVLSDIQLIRDADKSFVVIRDLNNRHIYEFYNMVLGSTQILENGDGTITVHYYLREFN